MIGFARQSYGKDGNNEDIDDEADKESDGCLYEVVHVGLPDLPLVVGVDVSRLDEGAVEVEVVRHDDGPNDTDRLQ